MVLTVFKLLNTIPKNLDRWQRTLLAGCGLAAVAGVGWYLAHTTEADMVQEGRAKNPRVI